MTRNTSIIETLRLCWPHVAPRLRTQLALTSLLMPLSTALDLLGLGLILPIAGVLQNETIFTNNTYIRAMSQTLGITNAVEFVRMAMLFVLGTIIIKSLFNFALNFFTARFISLAEKQFVIQMYALYLNSDVTVFHSRNISAIMDNIFWFSTRIFSGVILAMQQLAGELLLVFGIIVLIFVANPYAGLGSAALLVVFLMLYRVAFAHRLERLAAEWHDSIGRGNKILHESLGGILEVKALGKEGAFIERYGRERTTYAVKNYQMNGVRLVPRAYVEIMVATGIVLFVTISAGRMDNTALVSLLALYGVAALRLMPSVTRIIDLLTQIRSVAPNVRAVCDEHAELSRRKPNAVLATAGSTSRPRRLERRLDVLNLSYRYDGSNRDALERVSFTVERGRSLGIVGASGSGKTTLAHLLLGLLPVQEGQIVMDGDAVNAATTGIQRSMTFVPQHIFLISDSIRRNVAFGVADDQIDEQRLRHVLRLAQLEDFVASLSAGVETEVGERGVRLSGGQRQRLGIARALYFDAEIIILDEATSALDVETESRVSDVIWALEGERTVFIIAHRLSTVARCSELLFFDAGRLVDRGSFDELKGRNERFGRMVKLATLDAEQRIP